MNSFAISFYTPGGMSPLFFDGGRFYIFHPQFMREKITRGDMTNLIALDKKTIENYLGEGNYTELEITIAKNLVIGLDEESISQMLGVGLDQIRDLKSDVKFKKLYNFIALTQNQMRADNELTWDKIESLGLAKLQRFVQTSSDPEFILRTAVAANKSVRRYKSAAPILNPQMQNKVIILNLNQKFIKKTSNLLDTVESIDTAEITEIFDG